MSALDPKTIKQAAKAIEDVRSIDDNIERLGRAVEDDADDWGGRIRGTLGYRRLTRLTDERIGQIAFTGIVNDLLRERSEITGAFSKIVQFPDPPCPAQTLPEPSPTEPEAP